MDTLTQIIINMVKTTPNDVDLGKKVRALVQEIDSKCRYAATIS